MCSIAPERDSLNTSEVLSLNLKGRTVTEKL